MTEGKGFVIDRTIEIRAPRDTVFRYFTDSARFAAWWGEGSAIDPRPGGKVRIRYPNGVVASGEVVEIEPPLRIVFTYGYEGEGKPIPPGGSRVTIRLDPVEDGTAVALRHESADAPASVGAEHVQGWRYQMAVFANVVSREAHAGAASWIDAFFSAWNETGDDARRRLLEQAATDDVRFGDAFSCAAGRDDLVAHLAAVQRFMPGMTISRDGDVKECQGVAIAPWVARAAEGKERGRGTTVFGFAADGRIRTATAFWS
ncbi:MAG TPA: SRPBCC domain-containing protein [Thermoanaerobaculia bacterium]|nr:SRPBCC domain-containing protein [Thermoanaerobaculia bacterium]